MKFDEIILGIEKGNIDSLVSPNNTLIELGNSYLEEFSRFSLIHRNHKFAEKLKNTNFSNALEACLFLIDLLKDLPNMNGWLAKKSTEILNKALNTTIKLEYSRNRTAFNSHGYVDMSGIYLKSSVDVHKEFINKLQEKITTLTLIKKISDLKTYSPINYECPITLEQINEPIYYNSEKVSYAFEKEAILKWLISGNDEHPVTKETLDTLHFCEAPSYQIRNKPSDNSSTSEPKKLFDINKNNESLTPNYIK